MGSCNCRFRVRVNDYDDNSDDVDDEDRNG